MILNKKQKHAVFNSIGNTIITAPPGSGKTRTLVARAMHNLDSISMHKTLALITYTNVAADEISSRLITRKHVFIGTIHRFCLEYVLRPFGWIYKWNRPKVISYEQQLEFFEENPDIDLEENFGQNKLDELNKIKKNLDGSLDLNIEWDHSIDISTVAKIYFEYQNKINVIDFNEILYRSHLIINDNKFVSKSLSSKFSEILVDEFQDTNLYQYNIFKLINTHNNCTFFMVGDSKQKIFSFAGAIENSFEKAQIDFNASHINLTEVYRSTNNIVNSYTSLFEKHPLVENKSDNSALNINIPITETTNNNQQETIQYYIKVLLEKHNVDISEIAVLSTSWYTTYPSSKNLRQIYNVVGLGALPHKNINNSTFNILKILAKYSISSSIKTLRGIKRNTEVHLLENNITYSDNVFNKKINYLTSSFLSLNQNVNIAEGINILRDLFDRTFDIPHNTFDEILELISDEEKRSWNIAQYISTLAGVNGITCNNTIHKAKGLEFDAVILNQVNENKIPFQKCLNNNPWTYQALTQKDIEDGKNLLYVGISRARKYLVILHNWKPSMFIELLKD